MKHLLLVVALITETLVYSQTWTSPGTFTDQVYAFGTKGTDFYAGCYVNSPPQTPSKLLYRFSNGVFDVDQTFTNYASAAFIKTAKEYRGSLYIGGSFVGLSGPNPVYCLASDKNGFWNNVGQGYGAFDIIFSLEEYNSRLFAAGVFTNAGGVLTNGIAAWNDTTWSVVGGSGISANSAIQCMAVYNNELYVGGKFNSVCSVPVNSIAKWNGANWFPVGFGLTGNVPAVTSMEIYNNELYVAGYFTSAGGDSAYGIARWNGNTWNDGGAGVFNESIFDLEVYQGELYAGGNFTAIGGVQAKSIAKWNGTSWSPVGSGLGANQGTPVCTALKARADGLYIGGVFDTAGGISVSNIARWSSPPAGLEEIKASFEVSLYPNPASDELFIHHSFSVLPDFFIYDTTGRLLFSGQLPSDGKIKISALSSGVYLIRCQQNSAGISQRFVVIK